MIHPRAALLLAAVLFAIPHPSAGAATDDGVVSLGEDLEVDKLAEGVWLHVCRASSNGMTFTSNGLVLAADGEALIIDTPWDESQTARLLDWVEASLGVPVRHAIVAHSHQDNMGGIDVLHARRVVTHGLELTASLAVAEGKAPPTHVFDQQMTMEVGGEPVEAWFPGGGHTRDNIVVWLPGKRVLFGGCLIKSADARGMGNTADADLEAWPSSVRAVRDRYPEARIIVPGHGAPGGDGLIENTLRLLAEHAQGAD